MSQEKSGPEAESIRLQGSITLQALLPLLATIRRTAQQRCGTLFRLDCAAVTDISDHALTELVRLRREVRSQGCELVLSNCRSGPWKGLSDAPKEQVSREEPSVKKDGKLRRLQGPHEPFQAQWRPAKTLKKVERREPYFLRLRGTRYQRFWWN
jgi:ABC-type transporter Mla MlaB component